MVLSIILIAPYVVWMLGISSGVVRFALIVAIGAPMAYYILSYGKRIRRSVPPFHPGPITIQELFMMTDNRAYTHNVRNDRAHHENLSSYLGVLVGFVRFSTLVILMVIVSWTFPINVAGHFWRGTISLPFYANEAGWLLKHLYRGEVDSDGNTVYMDFGIGVTGKVPIQYYPGGLN